MTDGMRSIGAIARASGLSVSALRFYDGAGVFRPARVDPATGYRWYDTEQLAQARLIAVLRRVGMPLPDIGEVLAARADPSLAGAVIDRHLRRLEDSLDDARRLLGVARQLLDQEEKPVTRFTLVDTDLAAAVAAVRFAVGADPEVPALTGVLFDYDGAELRLVASDRYRLAVATVAASEAEGPPVQTVVPVALLDALEVPTGQPLTVRLDGREVTVGHAHGAPVDAVFPDYRQVLRAVSSQRVRVSTSDLHDRVAAGPTRPMPRAQDGGSYDVTVLGVTDDAVDVLTDDHPDGIGFNREFLLQALVAADSEQLTLAFDGPVGPLAIMPAERADVLNMLMPTRLT